MLQTPRFDLPGRPPGRYSNAVNDEPFSHPLLSPAELECLALRISTMDGVTPGEARRQIAEFRSVRTFGLDATDQTSD